MALSILLGIFCGVAGLIVSSFIPSIKERRKKKELKNLREYKALLALSLRYMKEYNVLLKKKELLQKGGVYGGSRNKT